GVVVVSVSTNLDVLVEVIGDVVRRDAIDDRTDPVADRVVLVPHVLAGEGRVGGGEGRVHELPGGVVFVGPGAVERAHSDPPAEHVVGVVEARVDRIVGPAVDQVQELTGGVVLVGGEAATAQVLAY